MLFLNILKVILIIWHNYDPSGNSNFRFQVGANILSLLFLHDFFVVFHVCLNLINQHNYHFFLGFFFLILPERLSKSLWGSNVLLLCVINIASTLFYNFIEFIILLIFLVTFLVNFQRRTYFYFCKCYWQSLKDFFRS